MFLHFLLRNYSSSLGYWYSDQADEEIREVQVDLAIDILKALYDSDHSGELASYRINVPSPDYCNTGMDQKILCQLLGQLRLPAEMKSTSQLKLNILISNLQEVNRSDFYVPK